MKILHVEDDQKFARELQESVKRIAPDCEFITAEDRDSALSLIEKDHFHLLIADRAIPAGPGEPVTRKEYGDYVFQRFAEMQMPMPIIVLTGQGESELSTKTLKIDPRGFCKWGIDPNCQRVFYFPKSELLKARDCIADLAKSYDSLRSDIEIRCDNGCIPASLSEALRINARRLGLIRVDARLVSDGLSGASIVICAGTDPAGNKTHFYAAKHSEKLEKLRLEENNYRDHVRRLSPGCFAEVFSENSIFSHDFGTIFYNLVAETPLDLFTLLSESNVTEHASGIIGRLFGNLEIWSNACTFVNSNVGEIRANIAGDITLSDYLPDKLIDHARRFEGFRLGYRSSIQHGDLHGANILINRDNAIMIDYGDVRNLPRCFDAAFLELSLLFHPAAKEIRKKHLADTITYFFDLKKYCSDDRLREFISCCRSHQNSLKESDREIIAVVYSIAVRFLKYSDTDKEVLLKLIDACLRKGLDS